MVVALVPRSLPVGRLRRFPGIAFPNTVFRYSSSKSVQRRDTVSSTPHLGSQTIDKTLGAALNATRDRYASKGSWTVSNPVVRRAELWDRIYIGCCAAALCALTYFCGMSVFRSEDPADQLYDRYGRRLDPETHTVKPRFF